MGQNFHIRVVEDRDMPALLGILNHSIENEVARFENDPWSLAKMSQWARVRHAAHPLRVAERGGQAVGFACLGPFDAMPGYARTAELSVYVDPNCQRLGIARALCDEVLTLGEAAGVHLVVSRIAGESEGSLRLHEKLGFEHVGVLKEAGWKLGRWVDVHFMQRRLGGVDSAG